VRAAEARAENSKPGVIDALDRLHARQRVIGVLRLFERPVTPALPLAPAEAAVVEREHEPACGTQPSHEVYAVEMGIAAVTRQHEDAGPWRIARPPLVRRAEIACDAQTVAVKGDIGERHGANCAATRAGVHGARSACRAFQRDDVCASRKATIRARR
jgi:hypothetical protein